MQTPKKPGFTLIEMLVVLAVLSIIAALLFPVFARARERARQATCASNLRQIGMAAMQYIGDNDGRLFNVTPYADDFGSVTHWSHCTHQTPGSEEVRVDTGCGPLGPFLKSAAVWRCPSASGLKAATYYDQVPPAYGLNWAYSRMEHDQERPVALAQAEAPAETIFAADSAVYNTVYSSSAPSWSAYVYLPSEHASSVHGRHSGMVNVLWLDGHVTARRPVAPDAARRSLNIGDILKGPYTGHAKTDDYYYALVKPKER